MGAGCGAGQVRREALRRVAAQQFASQMRVAGEAAMRPGPGAGTAPCATPRRHRPARLPPRSDNITINVAWTLFGRYVIVDCGSP